MPDFALRFTEFLQGTVLEDISIWSVAAERYADKVPDDVGLQYGEASKFHSCEQGRAVIDATYGVRLVREGSVDALAEMEVTLRAIYSVPETMDEELFAQFSKVTLRIHTVAFAREWFRDMSSRMGLTPIILPLALAHPAAVPAPKKAKPQTSAKNRSRKK